jgi:nicotinamidase-related amidase
MSNRALILVDIQNDYFAGGAFPLDGIDAASANAARVLEAARRNGDRIIHIQHQALSPEAGFFVPGTEGVEINAVVRPAESETVVVKNYPNSFRATPLKEILETAGIEDVVIVGAMSHMCIAATGRAAADFGYRTTVIHDACATRALEFGGVVTPSAQVHAANMAALAFGYAKVVGTQEHLAG